MRLRVPGAMQRVALAKRCFAEPGPRFLRTASNRDPGSAAHRSARATRCAASGARKSKDHRSRKCECIPIPALKTCLILLVSCPVRGASRGVTEVGQSESLIGEG